MHVHCNGFQENSCQIFFWSDTRQCSSFGVPCREGSTIAVYSMLYTTNCFGSTIFTDFTGVLNPEKYPPWKGFFL